MSLLYTWTVMAVLGLAAIGAALAWAVKNRQFSRSDRAARLALRSHIPDDEPPRKKEAKP